MSRATLSHPPLRTLPAAIVLLGALALSGCTPSSPEAASDTVDTPSPVVTLEISTGYTPAPTPTPTAASRRASCAIAVPALDAAQSGLNAYASRSAIEPAFADAVNRIDDAQVKRLMETASRSLTAYLVAPQGEDAAEKSAWRTAAQAVRDSCA